MSTHVTDDQIARMLRERAALDVPGDLRDAIALALQADAIDPSRRGRRSWLRPGLLMAAALALASIAGIGLMTGSRPEPNPDLGLLPPAATASAQARSSLPPASPKAVATAHPSGPFTDWQPSAIEVGSRHLAANVVDLAANGHGFIAVGAASRGGIELTDQTVVWTSADGSAWQLKPADAGLEKFVPVAAAANAAGIVIAGATTNVPEAEAGAVLVSKTGDAWDRVSTPKFGTVVALPNLFVAASLEEPASIWTSPDGRAWTQVAGAAEFGEGSSIKRLRVLRLGGRETVVAVGRGFAGGGPGMWIGSGDGATGWRRVTLEGGPAIVGVFDVAGSDNGQLAIGFVGYCCRLYAWTSPDATAWEGRNDPAGFPATPGSVVATPSGYLVAATAYLNDARSSLRAWRVDGEGWTALPLERLGLEDLPMGPVLGAVRSDGAVIVVTSVGLSRSNSPSIPTAFVVQPGEGAR